MKGGYVVFIVIGCVLVLLLVGFIFSRSRSYTTEVDITCGRIRHTYGWCGFTQKKEPQETEISKLYRELLGEPPEPKWRTAFESQRGLFTLTTCEHQRGYAMNAANELAAILHVHPETEDAVKRQIVVTFFGLLQNYENYSGHDRAIQYVESLRNLDRIDSEHLPEPPTKIEQPDEREVHP